MKKFLSILAIVFTFAICSAEEVSPSYHTEIERKVSYMDIEGTIYYDVVVNLKSNEPDYVWVTKGKVRVTITDKEGKVIYKKKLKDAYLYIFRSGQIQVGKKNFDKLVIFKSDYSNSYSGKIREMEGVY